VAPAILDVNAVITETLSLVRRLIGENVILVEELAPELQPVRIDPGQLQQVLINLAVNGRDAMPHGGRLRIVTRAETMENFARRPEPLPPGRYVVISVEDDGMGMDAETQTHLFEPFFTTKPAGKGTGLGLATVFGIVKQSNGYIGVESEPGRGARFDIYLPASAQPVTTGGTAVPAVAGGGSETILIVEDDDAVRSLAATILGRLGYTLLIAASAEAALKLVEESTAAPDLVLSDVIMPGMTGPDLVRRLTQRYPRVRALFTSGYPGESLSALGMEEAGTSFIEKPYAPAGLAARVREALAR
jgi:two-component system, cell cycle sensor histidine kinase and response regulator CckA